MPRRFPSDGGASKGHKNAMTDPTGTNSEPTLLRSEPLWAGLARRKRSLTIIIIVAVALIGALIWYLGSRPDPAKNQGARKAADRTGRAAPSAGGIPVGVASVRQGTFDVYLFALGTVTPLSTVLVRSRVDGQIMRVAFDEGQMVSAGDLLAEIDPRPFEVQLTLATGQLARNQALLENARIDLDRYRTLLAQDSISRQQVDTQESLVRQYEAAVQSDQGGIANARLQLTHARIVAPITGRVGLRQVDPGNIVRATDTNGIVVITQLQPIGVVFPIPEDSLPRVMKRLRSGDRILIDAFDRAQKERLGSGRLLTADNQIDTATGTVKLKGEFPNADKTLFPNQFVNVRLPIETRQNATLVPSAAVQRGAAGTFVYVVKDDLTVAVTPVKLGPVQGEISTVDSGVAAGAKVVIDGADRLRDGVKVEPITRAGGGA
jgi:multidrug efflux system membrane fusion protein